MSQPSRRILQQHPHGTGFADMENSRLMGFEVLLHVFRNYLCWLLFIAVIKQNNQMELMEKKSLFWFVVLEGESMMVKKAGSRGQSQQLRDHVSNDTHKSQRKLKIRRGYKYSKSAPTVHFLQQEIT